MSKVKVILLGPYGVGKTCLVKKYFTGVFSERVNPSIDTSFECKDIETVDGQMIKMCVWDTAGQERYDSILPIYFRGADIAIICTSRPNIRDVKKYYDIVQKNSPELKICIAITQSDLISDLDEYSDLVKFCEFIDARIFFTSSKTGENIGNVFEYASGFFSEIKSKCLDLEDLDENRWWSSSYNYC